MAEEQEGFRGKKMQRPANDNGIVGPSFSRQHIQI